MEEGSEREVGREGGRKRGMESKPRGLVSAHPNYTLVGGIVWDLTLGSIHCN